MATKQRSSAKADFIRSFPVSTPAVEVVEKAKTAGLSVSPAHVYGVRKTMSASRPRPKPAARATPAPPPKGSPSAEPAASPPAGSKKAFVLSYPADTPAQEVVRAAAARGIDLSPGYLYWVRSEATRTGRRAGAFTQNTTTTRRAGDAAGQSHAGEGERLIVETALRIVGIERAIEVLEAARARLGRLLDE